jgi:hypothetical protein
MDASSNRGKSPGAAFRALLATHALNDALGHLADEIAGRSQKAAFFWHTKYQVLVFLKPMT